LITGYLEKEESLSAYVEQIKEERSKNGKSRRAASRKLQDLGKENKNKFALSEKEVHNIYDLLEEEFPEI
jgi:hypothetical protein